MEFNPLEIDYYDYTTCPFNKSHRLQNKDKFIAHVTRCKDQETFNLRPRIIRCPSVFNHFFICAEELKYHVERCAEHQEREDNYTDWVSCQNNPNHKFRQHANDIHMTNCPNSVQKWFKAPAPALDGSFQGRMNYQKGLFSSEDIVQGPSKKLESSEEGKVAIYYGISKFDVFLKKHDLDFRISEFVIDGIVQTSHRSWPGLRDIEQTRSHRIYLKGYLLKDRENERSSKIFDTFQKHLAANRTQVAISYQESGLNDEVMILAASEEPSGFGAACDSYSLALFAVPFSLLLSKQSLSCKLTLAEQQLKGCQTGNFKLRTTLEETQAELSSALVTKGKLELSYNTLNAEYSSSLTEFKEKTKQYLAQIETIHANQSIELKQDKERLESELNILTQNQVAELKNLRIRTSSDFSTVKAELDATKHKLRRAENDVETYRFSCKDKDLELLNYKSSFDNSLSQLPESEKFKRLKDQLQERETCTICYGEKKNTVFFPCGHLSYCNSCVESSNILLNKKVPRSNVFSTCPACLRPIDKIFRCFPY